MLASVAVSSGLPAIAAEQPLVDEGTAVVEPAPEQESQDSDVQPEESEGALEELPEDSSVPAADQEQPAVNEEQPALDQEDTEKEASAAVSQPESQPQEQPAEEEPAAQVLANEPTVVNGLQQYTVSMETAENWEVSHGDATVEIRDGRLFMQTADGNESNNPAYALAVDNNSPVLSNGEVTATLTNNFAGRFCLVFRYQDKNNYCAVGHDVGQTWVVKTYVNGKETNTNFTGPVIEGDGKDHTIQTTFVGKNVVVKIDGTEYYNGDVLDDSLSGKLGLRTWGYTGNYASISASSITYNEVKAPEKDEDGNYMTSFTNADCRGGWSKAWSQVASNEGLSFVDGEGEDGYMHAFAGPDGVDNGNTFLIDSMSPSIENGFVEFDVTNQSAGRIAFLFRVQDISSANNKKYVGVQYDVGSWNVVVNGTTTNVSIAPTLEKGVKHHIRIEYVGENIRMLMDGVEVLDQNFAGSDIGEGKIGLRVWGWGTGDNQGKVDVDKVVNGYFNAVMLNPSEKYVLRSEAGSYDLPITLSQTGNAFVGLKVGDAALTEGTDYTVSEDKSVVTLTKDYIASVKDNGTTQISFCFADGFITTFKLQVQGAPEEEVEYTRNFADGIDGFELVSGTATLTADADKKSASVTGGQNAILIDQDSPELHNGEVEFTFDPKNDSGNLALVLRYQDASNWVAVGIGGVGGNHTQWYAYTPAGSTALFSNSGDNFTKGDGDGQRLYSDRAAPYTVKVRLVENTITVWVDGAEILQTNLPGLPDGKGKFGVRYTSGAGADIYNLTVRTANPLETADQTGENKTIASDEMTVTLDSSFPRVVSYELDGKTLPGQEKPYYVVEVNNKTVVPTVTADFAADKATYHVNADGYTFDAVFSVEGNVLSLDLENIAEGIKTINFPNQSLVSMPSTAPNAYLRESNYTGEWTYDLTARTDTFNHQYTSLAVLSSDELAATVNCGSIKSRSEVVFQTFVNGDHYTTGLWPNEFLIRGLDNDVIDGGNWAKVAVTGDRNSDGKVDYQDGAIALRDDIPTERTTSDEIFYAYTSIAVNEASWAQHPFLKALDLVKKMSLGLDGFNQNVIYKGYQSQGHDSAHPSFDDINEQAGGEEDLRTLIANAGEYNTTIGVHINETEAYPESAQYGALASDNAGWAWYDQANQMVRENDILSSFASRIPGGNMIQRLANLKEITDTETGGLGIVYVDTYFDTRWPAYRLAKELNDNGWALATEYVDEFTGTSVWGHHIGSGFNNTGNLVRFVNNGTMDIFAYSSLFRGSADRHSNGIYGWQADTTYGQNYLKTQEDFFIRVLPNKYLASYPISIWEEDNRAVLGENNEVVTEMVNGKNVITVNGRVVADGNKIFIPWDPTEETKIYHWNDVGGSTTWTLPESWAGETEVKLFKLDDKGRTEMKLIPVENGQVTIEAAARTGYVVYKGSDPTGETDLTEYEWSEGSPVKDTGFNSYSWDYAWTKSSTADTTDHITYSNDNATNIGQGDTNILVQGVNDATLSQTMTGLEGGKTYSASVFVDVSDGRRAAIEITTPDGKTVSNYTEHYYGVYGSSHSDKKASNYQRIKVQFTMPEGESTALIRLVAAAGADESAYVRFDDVRIYEINADDYQGHYYFEDFEDFDVGFGPFENGISGQNHMSETSEFTNDTINGRYSLKIQNFEKHATAYTTPATLRLPTNSEVTVSVQYLVSNGGSYTLSAKENGEVLDSVQLAATGMGSENAQTATLTFTTGDSGEAYLDLARTNGTIVLDDLVVDVKDTEAPQQPTDLQVSEVSDSSAVVDWTAAEDNARIECYNIYLNGELVGTTTAQRYTFTGLDEKTTYTVTVEAVDFGGNTSSAETTFTTAEAPDTEAPQAPSGITAGKVTAGKVDISWNASTDNVGVTAYEVYLNGELYATVTGTGVQITGLKAGSYTVEVYAVDAAGNRSAAASFTLKVEDESSSGDDGTSPKPDGGSSGNTGDTGSTGNAGTGTATPATGDPFAPALLLAVMGSALAAFVGLRRRQRR